MTYRTDLATGLPSITKAPTELLDYTFDFTAWLAEIGDTISSHTVTLSPSGPTITQHANTTTAVTAWVSGGTAGTSYTLTSQITTAGGRTASRSILITVKTYR